MDDGRYRKQTARLVILILGAALYTLGFQNWPMPTGNRMADGAFSVLLGLYICAHPAGNAIDLIFIERDPLRSLEKEWSSLRWLALNILTLVMGWRVIDLGTTHLASRAG